jgi:hypothetical protein
LAHDHQVDLNRVIGELCEWAFYNPKGKKQFKLWLDDAFTPKGEAEDQEQAAGARERASEEERPNSKKQFKEDKKCQSRNQKKSTGKKQKLF